MTIQQEATNLIYSLPDENVKLIVDVMRKMLMPVINVTTKNQSLDTAKRIGLGKGIIYDPENFDVWNTEILIYLRVQTYEISGKYTYFNMGIM